MTVFCAIFANDIILVVLGPKWTDAILIFRLLTPTVLVFGLINPTTSLLYSMGLEKRSLMMAIVIAPLTITGYFIGLPFGPEGVASGFSIAMMIWLIPHVLWALHGTMISPKDILLAIARPFLSATVAAACAFGAKYYADDWGYPLLNLIAGGVTMLSVYSFVLLFIMNEKDVYLLLLKELKGPTSLETG